ncbi:hypothetical protein PENSTE_c011G06236 [Penicillium steckii]|uniref:Uncharacterized protein n=1 Tax=Penicillium steckii TaxID=303698 RepID=A0A1V6T6Y0_9EURO|nr:hypothetical protein PENSTE_c011G06236 [Penicillium steckii]
MLESSTVWFVTGCSSGVGRSLVSTVYEAGHRVIATARNVASLSYIPDESNVLKLKLDGPVFITQEAARIFRETNPPSQGGTIIQISSIGGLITFPGSAFYHASKFALGGFTESFAKEMNPNWIINLMVVAPGGIQTSFGSNVQFTTRHPEYNTPASPLNQLLSYMTDTEVQMTFATPDSCARTVFDVVIGKDQRPLPRRLLIGAETISLMEADIKKTVDEMQSWKAETHRCSAKSDHGETIGETM